MKKICTKCGRNRLIGKFGNCAASPDGKSYYCRDCKKNMNRNYKLTQNGMAKTKRNISKWKKENRDKIKKYNKEYYKKNKDRILYNKKCREETECVLIFDEPEKPNKRKINKIREIHINPKRKQDG